jgi:DNA-binding XRE family transcriptional regulator
MPFVTVYPLVNIYVMTGVAQNNSKETQKVRLDNYIRAHRKRAGLSQRELGQLIGYSDEGSVARHEGSKTLPPMLIGLAYEIVFQTPMSELFPGIRDAVKETLEPRLLKFEAELHDRIPKATRVKQKIAWLSERRNHREN